MRSFGLGGRRYPVTCGLELLGVLVAERDALHHSPEPPSFCLIRAEREDFDFP